MAKKFISQAIQRPGALRAAAKRRGLLKGDEPLSESDLDRLESAARASGDTTLLRRVNLARTLRKMPRRRRRSLRKIFGR